MADVGGSGRPGEAACEVSCVSVSFQAFALQALESNRRDIGPATVGTQG